MRVQGKRIWIAGQLMPAQLEIQNGTITEVLPYGSGKAELDWGELRVFPGFIDIHTHGAYGYDTNDGTPEGLKDWMRRIPQEGVTSILPTTVTQMPDVLEQAVANVAAVAREMAAAEADALGHAENAPAGGIPAGRPGVQGAEILGIHFEGPYLDMEYKGAQPPEAIAAPSVEQFCRYQEAAEGLIKYITLASEHDPDWALTRYCASHGVVVSMGHSNASYEDALMGAANGASSMTHVYNAMSPYHHRRPGLVGAAFRLRDLYGELICDGCHSHLAAVNNLFAAKGRDHVIMVTDSLRAKHCPPGGSYQLGGHDIEIGEDGLARLAGTDTIAGSTLRMNKGLKILVEEAQVPLDAAVNSCTLNPARCLGVDGRKGRIAAGCDADLAVLDADYETAETWCRGVRCWVRG